MRESRQTCVERTGRPYVFEQLHGSIPAMNEWELDEAAHRFRLLGDPTRLRILNTVMKHGELSVQQIAELAKASRFNTSAHLNRLALRGMVARRRQGSTVYYRIGDEQLGRLCDAMCASLQVHAGNVSRAAGLSS